MARLPYADFNQPDVKALADQITAERGSVLILYQMLLHSPVVAQGWLNHLTGIRHHSSLAGDVRELVIMRVALLNRAPYEADQHAPIALKEGVTEQQLEALSNWQDSDAFDEKTRAILAYTDAMTLNVQVEDAIFNAVKAHFDDKQFVELTATIATYNMVSRFLEALQIHTDDEQSVS